MTHWCGTCCVIIMIRLPRDVAVLAVLVLGSFLTWICCSYYFLFFFFYFWFLSDLFLSVSFLKEIVLRKLFWKNLERPKLFFEPNSRFHQNCFRFSFFLFRWKLKILQFYSWDMWLFSIYGIRQTNYLDLGQLETRSNNQNYF